MEDRLNAFLKKGMSDEITPEDAEIFCQNRPKVCDHNERIGDEDFLDILLRGAKSINKSLGIAPSPEE